ncbi:MAG: DNA-binding protein [Myxococcota bacterium]
MNDKTARLRPATHLPETPTSLAVPSTSKAAPQAVTRGFALLPEVVDVHGASFIVGLAPATLNTLRSRGGGPPYLKLGRRVFYRAADLRAWRDARLRTNTAA